MRISATALAAALALCTRTASAQVDLAAGPEHEAIVRAACAARFDSRDCQCGLEALQARIGYEAFVTAAARSGDEFFRRTELPAVALTEGCARDRRRAVEAADLPIRRVADPTPVSAPASLQASCRAREAAVVPGIRALLEQPDPRGTASLQAVVGNLARAREACAAGDLERAIATYDHVAIFLAAGGFGDASVLP